jgi:hypothetical protein
MIDYFIKKVWTNPSNPDITYTFTVTVTRTKGTDTKTLTAKLADTQPTGGTALVVPFPDSGWDGFTGDLTGTIDSESATGIKWTDKDGNDKGSWPAQSR